MLHLAQHRARLGVEATVEDDLGVGTLDRGQERRKIDGLVVGELFRDDLKTARRCLLAEGVGNALAIGGAIVHDRDTGQLEVVSDHIGQRRAGNVVIGEHSKGCPVPHLRQPRIGGDRADVRNPAVVVNLG